MLEQFLPGPEPGKERQKKKQKRRKERSLPVGPNREGTVLRPKRKGCFPRCAPSLQGGLGAVPGFGWWPIKAYRPCPAFVASGGRYRRQGQSLDEVAFGRKGPDDDLDVSERLEKLADSDVAARIKRLKEEEDKARST